MNHAQLRELASSVQELPAAVPSISVIIPTRNRPEQLAACVASVLACAYPRFSVIVIDQSAIRAELPTDSRLTYIQTTSVGKSRGLNEGIAVADGEIIAFTDDDCTVPVSWLQQMVAVFGALPATGVVAGPLSPIPHDPAEAFIPGFAPERYESTRSVSELYRKGVAGANLIMRAAVIGAVVGFDEEIGPGALFPAYEEIDITHRALQHGFDVTWDPRNAVTHWGVRPYADGSGQRLRRDYRLGEGALLIKHARCGEWGMLRILAAELAGECASALRTIARGNRPTGLGRAAYLLRGAYAAVWQPLDHQRRLFRHASAH